jgi:hypothetical protein
MADRLTHEERVLYLMVELDQALARRAPQWTPQQRNVVRRRLVGLLGKLLASLPPITSVT